MVDVESESFGKNAREQFEKEFGLRQKVFKNVPYNACQCILLNAIISIVGAPNPQKIEFKMKKIGNCVIVS